MTLNDAMPYLLKLQAQGDGKLLFDGNVMEMVHAMQAKDRQIALELAEAEDREYGRFRERERARGR